MTWPPSTSLPPTRSVGQVDPPADVNSLVAWLGELKTELSGATTDNLRGTSATLAARLDAIEAAIFPGAPSGTSALWNPTTSPARVKISWGTAVVDSVHVITTAMIDPSTAKPYVAGVFSADSGCKTYWTTSSEVGRLTVTASAYGVGTHSGIVCPVGAQPAASGTDRPLQIIQPDNSWVDIFGGASGGATISWVGNNGTWSVEGYLRNSSYLTDIGWPVGNTTSYVKEGFAAAGNSICTGAITPEDKQLGYIAHALEFSFNNAGLKAGPIAPATREDTNASTAYVGPFAQGTLLALKPKVNGGATRPTGLTAWENAICDALEQYGGYVTDRTGGWTMRCQTIAEPGVTATLTSSDFAGFMSLTAGSLGKFLFDNLRSVTKAKLSIAYHA